MQYPVVFSVFINPHSDMMSISIDCRKENSEFPIHPVFWLGLASSVTIFSRSRTILHVQLRSEPDS